MTWLESIVTAVVEGLTEFLPVSSTAHIKFAQAIMGMDAKDSFTNMFDIVIQLAAILAVLVMYWKKFVNVKSIGFYVRLLIAVIPSLIIGALFKKHIEELLGKTAIIAAIVLVGGVLLLFVDEWFSRRARADREEDVTNKTALQVGLFQILAIVFPGFSRSAATIIGGMASGLTRRLAAEFSFFLAVPTMAAATAKEVWDTYKLDHNAFRNTSNLGMLGIGCLVSFIVSLVAIKFFITYVQRHTFRAFGVYRIIAGAAMLVLIYMNVIKG